MNKIVIGIHHRWLSDVMSALHQEGNLEIIDLKKSAGEEIPQKQLDLPRQEIEQIISLHFRIDRAFEVLAPYEKTPRGIPSILSPKSAQRIKTNYSTREEVLAAAREELRQVESVHFASESLKRNRELQQTARDHITDMRRLLILGCDLSYLAPSPYTAAVAGWIDERARPLLESWQASSHSDEISVYTAPSGNEIIVLCIGTRAMTPLLEELIHQSWFVHIQLPESYSGNPEERIAAEESKIDALRKEEEELLAHLHALATRHLSYLRAIREELTIWRDRIEVSRNFGSSLDVIYMQGWIRQKDTDRLSNLLSHVTNDEYFLFSRPAHVDDAVPVRYDNPAWLAPFEILTTTFSRPRYDEIDPTPFFAPAYLLFFGLMLGDAGYGIIIALVGLFLYYGPGRSDATVHDMSYILSLCGIADIILGTVQGGWFGDLLPRFFNINPPFVLIEPLNQPILLFQIALVIGTIHLNLGILLGLWQNLRARMYRTALVEQVVWFILQPSAAILLVEFFGWMTFSPLILNGAVVGAVSGLVILFAKKGPMGFFSLTGFLGDWLSYVRILALALATGGIAMTINILSEMIASVHPLMIIPALLFCVAGQIFNLAIQTLGSVIHALRLHYIEFFGKFFSGGGRAFVPFHEERIYTIRTQEEG